MNIERDAFIDKYNLDVNMIEKINIDWNKLDEIYYDFIASREQLEVYSNLLAELLRKHPKVHTVRSRIKDPEHLIAKLIRKTPDRKQSKGEDFEFTIENYRTEITDLIGVRVIHIFKEDWKDINDFVDKTWSVKELQVNIREGDSRDIYEEQKIPINYRETGYRSVHYLIEFSPTNEILTAEIQVRTIFEEGYGEIDHLLSYPNNNIPKVLTLNLLMLNRLAGSADEMSSAVLLIKDEWGKMQDSLISKDDELKKLESRIEKLNIEKQEKESLVKDIDKIRVGSGWINNLGNNIYSINTDGSAKIGGDWPKGVALKTGGTVGVGGDWPKGVTLKTDGIVRVGGDWTKEVTLKTGGTVGVGSEWTKGVTSINTDGMTEASSDCMINSSVTDKASKKTKILGVEPTQEKTKIQTVQLEPNVEFE